MQKSDTRVAQTTWKNCILLYNLIKLIGYDIAERGSGKINAFKCVIKQYILLYNKCDSIVYFFKVQWSGSA